MSFADDLAKAKAERIPQMALRPDSQFPDELDDIVVKDVTMFRAEAMDDGIWWLCCYFANGESISFNVTIESKPKRITVTTGWEPDEWIDIDTASPSRTPEGTP
jgi:hypothetical protein